MTTRDWMNEGTQLFLTAVEKLDDRQLEEPSGLPGWSRKYVIAHVHYNAEALRRLVSWAHTGIETRMYDSPEQRASEIDAGARPPADQLRELVHRSARDLAADLDALPAPAWSREVITAHGRTVPATEIVWLRTREVAVHAIDLNAGVDFTDLPDDLAAALVRDVIAKRLATGEAAVLAAWLTGRTNGAPPLGPWL